MSVSTSTTTSGGGLGWPADDAPTGPPGPRAAATAQDRSVCGLGWPEQGEEDR